MSASVLYMSMSTAFGAEFLDRSFVELACLASSWKSFE